ncbi:MAG: hypothetical protein WKF77_06435 [Planctomycetaceae bacterium]
MYLASGEPTGDVAQYLSRTLAEWRVKNPLVWVRIIVPITSNGDTSELHAWYDRTLFPVVSQIERPASN